MLPSGWESSDRIVVGVAVVGCWKQRSGWVQSEPTIEWIDLGVFSDNPGAQAFYARAGFLVLGRTPDRFRVDGQSIDETWMTRRVALPSADG